MKRARGPRLNGGLLFGNLCITVGQRSGRLGKRGKFHYTRFVSYSHCSVTCGLQTPISTYSAKGSMNLPRCCICVELMAALFVNVLFVTYLADRKAAQAASNVFEVFWGPERSLMFFQRSLKCSRTSLYNHLQNSLKPRFMTILVLRWNSCSISKRLTGHQGQTLKKPAASPVFRIFGVTRRWHDPTEPDLSASEANLNPIYQVAGGTGNLTGIKPLHQNRWKQFFFLSPCKWTCDRKCKDYHNRNVFTKLLIYDF